MRLVRRIALTAGVLVLVTVAGLFFYLNTIAELAVERGATQALGVETSLRSMRVGLLAGECRLRGLRIANAKGFEDAPFLTLRDGRLAADLGSLRSDTVVVPSLLLDGIVVRLERSRGKTNYGVILDHLARPAATRGTTPAGADSGKKFVIREVRIRDIEAEVKLLPRVGKLTELQVVVPEIRLANVGSESGGGVLLSQLTRVVLTAVLDAVVKKGGNLPAEVTSELRGGLARVARVPLSLPGAVTRAGSKQVEELVGEAEKTLEEEAGRALRGLGGLLEQRRSE